MTKIIKCDLCEREYFEDERELWIEIISRTEDLHSKRLGLYCPRCGKKLVQEYEKDGNWILEQ